MEAEPQRVTLHESSTITVWLYPSEGVIHHEMHAYCFGQALRAALYSGTDAMRKYRATSWLSDDRVNAALAPDDEHWAANEWFPETKAAGWQTWALVKPRSAIGQLTMSRYVKLYGSLGITARFFSEPTSALSWLRERTGG